MAVRPVALLAAACAALLAGCAAAPELLVAPGVDVTFRGTGQLAFRLRRVIEDLLIDFERDPASDVPIFDAALDLQDHFVDQGYPEAQVASTVDRSGKSPRVTFDIHEGPLVTVADLAFHGHEAVRRAELLALWSRTRSGGLGLGDPLFVQSELEALHVSLLSLYDQRGFLEATIEGPLVDRAPGSSRAKVAFRIAEGPRYRFGAIAIAPSIPLTLADLDAAALAGRDFDRTTAATLGLRARSLLLHRGHPEPRVELEVTPDAATRTVAVSLNGDAGPLATVAAVTITGNERTAEHVIARHLHFERGDRYDGQAVEQTTSDLYRTGLFRRVEVERRAHDATGEVVDMTVRVDEIDAHELDLLLGYGSYETLRGGVFWTDRNLFGNGQRLQVGTRASLRGEALTASWSEPYFFGSDTSLTVGGQLSQREEPAFLDTSRGIDAAFARDLVGPLRGRLGYSLQARDGRDIDPTVGTAADSRYEIASAFAELLVDRRDSPLYPSRGHRLSLKLEHAGQGVGGNVDLDRVTWSSSWFLPLTDDLVFGLSARTAVIWPHGAPIPVQERVFNGGESTVRSFREAKLGPESITGSALGGAFSNTFNAELRFPIAGALHGAAFADAGNVGTDAGGYGLSDLRWALGGGLRFVLPIGPVRLDTAANPSPREGEARWTAHFSVGLPF